jgi:hypothetical protein
MVEAAGLPALEWPIKIDAFLLHLRECGPQTNYYYHSAKIPGTNGASPT